MAKTFDQNIENLTDPTTTLWNELACKKNSYATSLIIVIHKICLQLGKNLHLVLERCEPFGVFDMKTQQYLPMIAVYVRGIIVIARGIS